MNPNAIYELKVSQFNSAILRISELIGVEKKRQELVKQQKQLEKGIRQEKSLPVEVKVKEKKEKVREIEKKKTELEDYQDEVKSLVAYTLEWVFEDEKFSIPKEMVKEDFLKEYIYLLTEIERLDGERFEVSTVFSEKADLILLLYDKYGREKEALIYELINIESDETLSNNFIDYFEL